jgi:TonB family protein
MSVAAVTTPDWRQWEGEMAAGEFPLEQFLGAGEKSAVFRTRLASGDGAIKLVPAGNVQAEELVERWNRSRELYHPHLISIVRTGMWAKGGMSLAYLAMEYADENLATVLLERALTANETLEMLQPVAEVLAFLHAHGFVHGRLRPSNILAVKDTLKVSSDAVSVTDASADLRALAATVVECLTQQVVTFTKGASETNLIDTLPPDFQEIVRNCSGQNGRVQWSAAELLDWLQLQRREASSGTSHGATSAIATPAVPVPRSETSKPKLTYYAIVFALILVMVITVGRLLRNPAADSRSALPQPSGKTVEPASSVTLPKPQPKEEPLAAKPVKPPAPLREPRSRRMVDAQEQVVRQVLPNIPAEARRTIHGTATVEVRVTVDQSGTVTDASLQPGGSRYFGKLALEAARQWRFVGGSDAAPRERVLRFEISRTETRAFPERSAEQ